LSLVNCVSFTLKVFTEVVTDGLWSFDGLLSSFCFPSLISSCAKHVFQISFFVFNFTIEDDGLIQSKMLSREEILRRPRAFSFPVRLLENF
jgi:hypothetical protein